MSTPAPRLLLAQDAYAELNASANALQTKVGQLLVSATFFLTATTALLSVDDVRRFSYRFNNGSVVPLPLYLLVAFLLLTSLSVVHLTMALGLSLKPRRTLDNNDVSYVAWWSMVHRRKDEWTELFEGERNFDDYRLRHLIETTRYQARMVNYTYERLVEARAYFFVAVTVFSLPCRTSWLRS